jgi:hypothetical protein
VAVVALAGASPWAREYHERHESFQKGKEQRDRAAGCAGGGDVWTSGLAPDSVPRDREKISLPSLPGH